VLLRIAHSCVSSLKKVSFIALQRQEAILFICDSGAYLLMPELLRRTIGRKDDFLAGRRIHRKQAPPRLEFFW
jgi:hypothetical protein